MIIKKTVKELNEKINTLKAPNAQLLLRDNRIKSSLASLRKEVYDLQKKLLSDTEKKLLDTKLSTKFQYANKSNAGLEGSNKKLMTEWHDNKEKTDKKLTQEIINTSQAPNAQLLLKNSNLASLKKEVYDLLDLWDKFVD